MIEDQEAQPQENYNFDAKITDLITADEVASFNEVLKNKGTAEGEAECHVLENGDDRYEEFAPEAETGDMTSEQHQATAARNKKKASRLETLMDLHSKADNALESTKNDINNRADHQKARNHLIKKNGEDKIGGKGNVIYNRHVNIKNSADRDHPKKNADFLSYVIGFINATQSQKFLDIIKNPKDLGDYIDKNKEAIFSTEKLKGKFKKSDGWKYYDAITKSIDQSNKDITSITRTALIANGQSKGWAFGKPDEGNYDAERLGENGSYTKDHMGNRDLSTYKASTYTADDISGMVTKLNAGFKAISQGREDIGTYKEMKEAVKKEGKNLGKEIEKLKIQLKGAELERDPRVAYNIAFRVKKLQLAQQKVKILGNAVDGLLSARDAGLVVAKKQARVANLDQTLFATMLGKAGYNTGSVFAKDSHMAAQIDVAEGTTDMLKAIKPFQQLLVNRQKKKIYDSIIDSGNARTDKLRNMVRLLYINDKSINAKVLRGFLSEIHTTRVARLHNKKAAEYIKNYADKIEKDSKKKKILYKLVDQLLATDAVHSRKTAMRFASESSFLSMTGSFLKGLKTIIGVNKEDWHYTTDYKGNKTSILGNFGGLNSKIFKNIGGVIASGFNVASNVFGCIAEAKQSIADEKEQTRLKDKMVHDMGELSDLYEDFGGAFDLTSPIYGPNAQSYTEINEGKTGLNFHQGSYENLVSGDWFKINPQVAEYLGNSYDSFMNTSTFSSKDVLAAGSTMKKGENDSNGNLIGMSDFLKCISGYTGF